MGICINLSCKNESELNPDSSSIPSHPHHGYLLGKKEKEYLMKSVKNCECADQSQQAGNSAINQAFEGITKYFLKRGKIPACKSRLVFVV